MARLSDLRKVKEQKDPLVILDSMIKDHNKNKPRDFSSLLESVNTKDKIIKAKNAVINADKAVESVPTNSASQIATIRKKLDLDKEQLEPIENLITDMLDTQREELTTELTNNFQVQLGRVMEVADFALRQANSARILASGGSDGGGSSIAAIRDLIDDQAADSLGSIVTVPDPSSKFFLLVGQVTGIGQITFDFGNPPIILDNS